VIVNAGGKTFKSKASLTRYCQYVLHNARLGCYLKGEWEQVMRDVFKMHHHYDSKTKGMSYKIGVRDGMFTSKDREFFIKRSDGTTTDFSYRKAINQRKNLAYVKAALREAVNDQVYNYKMHYFERYADRNGYVVCAETNLKCTIRESHIDHYPIQFDEILQKWADENGVKSEEVELISNGDNSTTWRIKDQKLVDSFVEMHKEMARYRIVLNKVNTQRKRAKRAVF